MSLGNLNTAVAQEFAHPVDVHAFLNQQRPGGLTENVQVGVEDSGQRIILTDDLFVDPIIGEGERDLQVLS